MPDFSDLKKDFTRIEQLERELHLKQLQINRLLNITQAINDNLSSKDLYQMYQSFLAWEMGVKRMALFVRRSDQWQCVSQTGLTASPPESGLGDQLTRFNRTRKLDGQVSPFFQQFDVVIPVLHKDYSIAYAFIGGFGKQEDVYNKVQFITTITNIIAVAIENKRLFKQQIEQERIRRELELASQMQHFLVPSEFPSNENYQLAGIYKPHLSIGGDYFDFVELPSGCLVFCVGDISGKGLAAALLMASFQAMFHSLMERRPPLKPFIQELNRSMLRITRGERFITFFLGHFDQQSRKLYYINAGHQPPILVQKEAVTFLETGCTIIGMFEELPAIEIGEVPIPEEALILTFTDGLSDIQNEEGQYFDQDFLVAFARDFWQHRADTFNRKLMEHVDRFKGDQAYPDDFTVLTCKIFAPDSAD